MNRDAGMWFVSPATYRALPWKQRRKRLLLMLAALPLLCWLTSCEPLRYTSLLPPEPIRQTVTVQESPDAAYARAVRAMARMGAQVTQANSQARLLSATVHSVVVLNVTVQPLGDGASIEVNGSLLPDKLVIGSFDEVDQYMAYLQ